MLDGRHDPNVSFDRVENIGIGHLHAFCEQKGGILDDQAVVLPGARLLWGSIEDSGMSRSGIATGASDNNHHGSSSCRNACETDLTSRGADAAPRSLRGK